MLLLKLFFVGDSGIEMGRIFEGGEGKGSVVEGVAVE